MWESVDNFNASIKYTSLKTRQVGYLMMQLFQHFISIIFALGMRHTSCPVPYYLTYSTSGSSCLPSKTWNINLTIIVKYRIKVMI
jgi:hypothetical protein